MLSLIGWLVLSLAHRFAGYGQKKEPETGSIRSPKENRVSGYPLARLSLVGMFFRLEMAGTGCSDTEFIFVNVVKIPFVAE